jgi:ATP-dependent exoDNAse (exonuclease V) beta subunit
MPLHPAHERDAAILFEEAAHRYTVQGREDFTSVTTFIGKLFPEFDADAVIEKMMRSPRWAQSEYFGQTREEIKAAWTRRADLGTTMHESIELFYKEDGKLPADLTPEFAQFLAFDAARSRDLVPYRSEWRVFDEDIRIVGTIDMLFQRPDGTVEIYDWKRTKKIDDPLTHWNKYALHPALAHLPDTNYWHYALQLNLYQYILESKYGLRVVGRSLVALHPERAAGFEIVPVLDLQTEVRAVLADPTARKKKAVPVCIF